jgi:hypothetical protein
MRSQHAPMDGEISFDHGADRKVGEYALPARLAQAAARNVTTGTRAAPCSREAPGPVGGPGEAGHKIVRMALRRMQRAFTRATAAVDDDRLTGPATLGDPCERVRAVRGDRLAESLSGAPREQRRKVIVRAGPGARAARMTA